MKSPIQMKMAQKVNIYGWQKRKKKQKTVPTESAEEIKYC